MRGVASAIPVATNGTTRIPTRTGGPGSASRSGELTWAFIVRCQIAIEPNLHIQLRQLPHLTGTESWTTMCMPGPIARYIHADAGCGLQNSQFATLAANLFKQPSPNACADRESLSNPLTKGTSRSAKRRFRSCARFCSHSLEECRLRSRASFHLCISEASHTWLHTLDNRQYISHHHSSDDLAR